MTFTEVALRMFPFWIMGAFMLYATYQSKHHDLLRIEKKPLIKWLKILVGLTVYRMIIFEILKDNHTLQNMTSGAMMIPWQATLTVFWEDACHTMPLVILVRALGQDKLWKKAIKYAAIAVVMVSFGLGHVYQGWFAAALLSLYIPFTFKKGQEVGFGTIMVCHTLYDLLTILTIKAFLG